MSGRSSARSAGGSDDTDIALTAALRRHRPDRQRPAGAAFPRARLRQRLHQAGQHAEPCRPAQPDRARTSSATCSTFSGNAYYRDIKTTDLQRRHQRGLARRVALPAERRRAGRARGGRLHAASRPAARTPANTPFPSWRCIANVLLQRRAGREVQRAHQPHRTTPAERRLASAQADVRRDARRPRRNQFTVGAAYDAQPRAFHAVLAVRLSDSGPRRRSRRRRLRRRHAGRRESAFDARVDLDGRTQTGSVYATDTLHVAPALQLTLSGRYDRTDDPQPRRDHAGRRAGLARRRPSLQPLQSRRSGVTLDAVARR